MRLIVAGGRNYTDWEAVKKELDIIHAYRTPEYNSLLNVGTAGITEIVSGCCSQGIVTYSERDPNDKAKSFKVFGADGLGYRWAVENNVPVVEFPANWALFRGKAGPLRNGKMADYADALIAFPGTSGTDDMVNKAKKMGLIIFDRRNL